MELYIDGNQALVGEEKIKGFKKEYTEEEIQNGTYVNDTIWIKTNLKLSLNTLSSLIEEFNKKDTTIDMKIYYIKQIFSTMIKISIFYKQYYVFFVTFYTKIYPTDNLFSAGIKWVTSNNYIRSFEDTLTETRNLFMSCIGLLDFFIDNLNKTKELALAKNFNDLVENLKKLSIDFRREINTFGAYKDEIVSYDPLLSENAMAIVELSYKIGNSILENPVIQATNKVISAGSTVVSSVASNIEKTVDWIDNTIQNPIGEIGNSFKATVLKIILGSIGSYILFLFVSSYIKAKGTSAGLSSTKLKKHVEMEHINREE